MKAVFVLLFALFSVCSAFDGVYTESKYDSALYACPSPSDSNTVYATYSVLDNVGSFIATTTDNGESYQGRWVEKDGKRQIESGNMNLTRVGANWNGWFDRCNREDCSDANQREWNVMRQGGATTGAPECMAPQQEGLSRSLVGTWVGGPAFSTLYICMDDDADSTYIWGSSSVSSEYFVGYATEDGQAARGTKFFDLTRDVRSDKLWYKMRTGVWFFRQVTGDENVIYGQESVCSKNEEGTRCADLDEGRWVMYRRASGTTAGSEAPFAQCNSLAALEKSSAAAFGASLLLVFASVFAFFLF